MPYPRSSLHDHETIAVDLHPHWSFLVRPVVALVVGSALGVSVLVATDGGTTARTAAGWLAVTLLVLAIIWSVGRTARWATTHFVITSDRLIRRSGVLTATGVEIPIDRITTVHFSQGIVDRIVGAGDLVVESGGEAGRQRFESVADPRRMQREIHAQMDHHRRRRSAHRAQALRSIET